MKIEERSRAVNGKTVDELTRDAQELQQRVRSQSKILRNTEPTQPIPQIFGLFRKRA